VKKWTLGIKRILYNRGKSGVYRAASITFPKLSAREKLLAPMTLKDTRRHLRDTWEIPGDTDAMMTHDDLWSYAYFFCWWNRGICQLDGWIVGRLEGLFSVQEDTGRIHEVALVTLLRVRRSARPWGEEGMILVEQREDENSMHVIRIGDIEGIAHLIPLETGKIWLVNNRIDFSTWNELYA